MKKAMRTLVRTAFVQSRQACFAAASINWTTLACSFNGHIGNDFSSQACALNSHLIDPDWLGPESDQKIRFRSVSLSRCLASHLLAAGALSNFELRLLGASLAKRDGDRFRIPD
jgi:hypothetical protein